MNLISFKKLNNRNKIRIVNIVSSNYPYENIDDIYKFFLLDVYNKNIEYFIRTQEKSLVGIGYEIRDECLDLYWPFIKSQEKYLGQHKLPSFKINTIDVNNFKNLYEESVRPLEKKVFAYSSNYGMEKEIKNLLVELGLNSKKITQEDYWGEKYQNITDVKNDKINYKNLNNEMKIIRQNPEEEIYVLSN
jgi:hypothetical protein